MEEFLKETYGITVYQEQVMQLSQRIANFSKGDADLLRKAMGKKIIELLNKLKPKFTPANVQRVTVPGPIKAAATRVPGPIFLKIFLII